MLWNHLKVAWRNLWRQRLYSFLNILGLALGISSALLIIFWVQDELKQDQFHDNLSQLYQVMENQHYPEQGTMTTGSTPGIFGPWFKENYPEVVYASRVTWQSPSLLSYEGTSNFHQSRFVDPDFLQMFSYPLRYGDASTALTEMNSIILSPQVAQAFFGDENPVGKLLSLNDDITLEVTGVLEEVSPYNSLRFEVLIPFERFYADNESWLNQWDNNNVSTYAMLQEGLDLEAFNAKIIDIGKEYQENRDFFAYPLTKSYLYGQFENGVPAGGRIEEVRMFIIIALSVLLIACINFMNLSTAKAGRRSKEVGLRKVVGAGKSQLVGQFMGEALLATGLALLLAIGLVALILPWFNELTDKQISFDLLSSNLWLMLLLTGLITGLLSGSYPALYLSGFRPAAVLKGQFKSGKAAARFRKTLVVTQFALSIILVISTITVYRQLEYMIDQDLGFEQEQLINMWMQEGMQDNYPLVKEQLLKNPAVAAVTAANFSPLRIYNSTYSVDWTGKDPESKKLFSTLNVDFDWFVTNEVELLEGRYFDKTFIDTTAYILNETAANFLGIDGSVVGEYFELWDVKGKIVGVVKDFHFSSLHNEVDPLIILHRPDNGFYNLLVKSKPGKLADVISNMEALAKEHAPAYPFDYEVVSDYYASMYDRDQKTGVIFRAFALLSIIISCLGLFGLSAFAAEQRTKEVGIRKTLGAGVGQIAVMLSKEFTFLVLLASLIGCPIAWYLMHSWIQDFAYHINIGWALFVIATLMALTIAILTVLYHALRSARTNPVKALRYE